MTNPIPKAPGVRRYQIVALASILLVCFGGAVFLMRNERLWVTEDPVRPMTPPPQHREAMFGSEIVAATPPAPGRWEPQPHVLDLLIDSPSQFCGALVEQSNAVLDDERERILDGCNKDMAAYQACVAQQSRGVCVGVLRRSRTGAYIPPRPRLR